MSVEQKHLLGNELDDGVDTESQQSEISSYGMEMSSKRSWTPVALVVYSLIATALLIIPHLHQPRTPHTPYCKILESTSDTHNNIYQPQF